MPHYNTLYLVEVEFIPDGGEKEVHVYTTLTWSETEASAICSLQSQEDFIGKVGESKAYAIPVPIVASAYEQIMALPEKERKAGYTEIFVNGHTLKIPNLAILHSNQAELHKLNQEKQNV